MNAIFIVFLSVLDALRVRYPGTSTVETTFPFRTWSKRYDLCSGILESTESPAEAESLGLLEDGGTNSTVTVSSVIGLWKKTSTFQSFPSWITPTLLTPSGSGTAVCAEAV